MARATLIDGKAIAARLRHAVAETAAGLLMQHSIKPGLATILVGDDPASQVYVRSKGRACVEAGLASIHHTLPANIREIELLQLIAELNADAAVDGILVQLPLPGGFNASRVIAALAPEKDVDGFHPVNIGRLWSGESALVPCTPQGCIMLLRSVCADLTGLDAVVLGRSSIVGRPLAALLLAENCTLTLAHSRTRNPAEVCRRADIVIAGVGRANLITADWIKPGAIVIDVGINRVPGVSGLVGDVDFASVQEVAGAITPVPGGVGPMTIACLLRNTVLAACRRRGLPPPLELDPANITYK